MKKLFSDFEHKKIEITIDPHQKYDILLLLSHPIRRRRGGVAMQEIISFLLSIEAGVICHLICKWLDRNCDDE